MKAVGISQLKIHLSEYVRRAAAGESIMVTCRGKAVAELRNVGRLQPWAERYPGLVKLAEEGLVRLGLPNDPSLYRPRPVRSPAGTALRLLDEERGDR